MNRAIDIDVFADLCAPVPANEFIGHLLRTGFSPEGYRDAFPDLAVLRFNPTDALAHFFRYGLHERRVAPLNLDRSALVALSRLPLRDTGFKAALLASLAGHLFDNVAHPFATPITERWPAIQELTRAGAIPYFVAGDSHSHQFALTGARDPDWLLPIHMLCTGGSASGLANQRSRSGYGSLLRQAVAVIETLPNAQTVPFLLQFGQVDIEFVYHFQRVRDGRRRLDLDDYRAFCDRTLQRYIRFLSGLFDAPRRAHVYLVSVFPPALSDAAWAEGYLNGDIAHRESVKDLETLAAGIRGLQIADLRQRTDIHAYFNARLADACNRLGFGFIDGSTRLLGPDGLADQAFLIELSGGANHHLNYMTTYNTNVELLWEVFSAAPRTS